MTMNLSDGLDRLVEQYGQYGPEVQEWRTHPRQPAAAPVPITLERPAAAPLTGYIRDLSRSGVGFIVPARLNVGERFTLVAVLRGRSVRLSARVANCRRENPGSYFVGAELLQADRPQSPHATPPPPAAPPPPATPTAARPTPIIPPTPAAPKSDTPTTIPTIHPFAPRDEADELLRKVAALLDTA